MPGASMQSYRSSGGKIANRPMGEDAYGEASTTIRDMCPVTFPYTMGTQGTILDMLQSGGTKITSFKRGKLDGEPMIQINYEQQVDPDGNYGPWKCTLHIAPEEGYSLRTFSRTAGQGDRLVTVSGSLNYSLNSRSVPLLSSFERTQLRGGSGQVTERQSITISDFDTERPSPFIFSADGF